MPTTFLEKLEANQKAIQDRVLGKLNNNEFLTDEEIFNYHLTDDDKRLMEMINRVADGQLAGGFTLNDFLATPQAKVLIPTIVVGAMRKVADPMYLASAFFKKIRLKNGQALMFPSIGVMRAHDVAEGQEIPQEALCCYNKRR